MKFDIDNLTLGEIAQIEETSGKSVTEFASDDAPKGRLLIAFAWIVSKRTNPAFTLNEAEALTMRQVGDIVGGDPDPKAKP